MALLFPYNFVIGFGLVIFKISNAMRSSSEGPLLYSGTETRAVTMVTHCFAECGPDEMIFEKITSWVFCIVTPISCYSGDMLNPPLWLAMTGTVVIIILLRFIQLTSKKNNLENRS